MMAKLDIVAEEEEEVMAGEEVEVMAVADVEEEDVSLLNGGSTICNLISTWNMTYSTLSMQLT